MKTAQVPPVRVEPGVRIEIEHALRDGESLSQFLEAAALDMARRRSAQDEFLARGRAGLEQALANDEFYPLGPALEQMRARLKAKVSERRPRPKS